LLQNWSCDLFFSNQKPYLICADSLNGQVYASRSHSKRPVDVLKSFSRLVSQNNGRQPSMIVTDKGGEFAERPFSKPLFEKFKTRHKRTENFQKAGLAENTIGRLRQVYRKRADLTGDTNLGKNLPSLVKILNHTPNHQTGVSASSFKQSDSGNIFAKKYGKYLNDRYLKTNQVSRAKSSKFKLGDQVRLQFPNTTQNVISKVCCSLL
jgi:IS30 family transposase